MKKINIVLFEPEIPQNTGNIMRTCVGINAKLHLIKPLGFSLDEKHLKRSALDYFEYLDYEVYDNYQDFEMKNDGDYFFLTRYGKKTYSNENFKSSKRSIYLIFGKESTGVEKSILAKNMNKCFRIPTTDKIRSLNLSNSVAIVVFEVLRQNDFFDLEQKEPESLKGADFLDKYLEE